MLSKLSAKPLYKSVMHVKCGYKKKYAGILKKV